MKRLALVLLLGGACAACTPSRSAESGSDAEDTSVSGNATACGNSPPNEEGCSPAASRPRDSGGGEESGISNRNAGGSDPHSSPGAEAAERGGSSDAPSSDRSDPAEADAAESAAGDEEIAKKIKEAGGTTPGDTGSNPSAEGADPRDPAEPEPLDFGATLQRLRELADAHGANISIRRTLVGALIGEGSPDSLLEAERRLDELAGQPGVGEQWVRLCRAALADAVGELEEVEGELREAWLASLALLPLEIGLAHVTDGERDDKGGFQKRDSISYRPDDYVSVAFELRRFGVQAGRDGGFSYAFTVSARLLNDAGEEVSGFSPPDFTYRGESASPGNRFQWFEFLLKDRLPRDLAVGNYTVELTITDGTGKESLGSAHIQLDIRLR